MGSCLSRKGARPSNKDSSNKSENEDKQSPVPTRDPTAELAPNGPAPPPPPPSPLDDEAVVKEVLTETPLPSVPTTTGTKPKSAVDAMGTPDEAASAPTAVDEVCSVSVSFSASTTVVGEGTEEAEAETADSVPVAAKRRPRELPQAGKGHHQRKRSVSGEFPSWREARGGGAGRSLSEREATRASVQQVRNHGNGSVRVVRVDPGEKSRRRSASPVARREANLRVAGGRGGGRGVGSCSSTTRASPCRRPPPQRRTTAGGVSREMESGVEEDVEEEEEGGQLGAAALPGTEPEESLENPLVSLECFIFL